MNTGERIVGKNEDIPYQSVEELFEQRGTITCGTNTTTHDGKWAGCWAVGSQNHIMSETVASWMADVCLWRPLADSLGDILYSVPILRCLLTQGPHVVFSSYSQKFIRTKQLSSFQDS